MIDLHEAAAYNAYLFLDTISWDTAYPAPRHLDGTWRFMADHADASDLHLGVHARSLSPPIHSRDGDA